MAPPQSDKYSTDKAGRYSGLLRSTVSFFDPFQELLIIPLFDPVALFGTPSEPANVFGNLLHQLDHVGFIL
jgi:hypothetical protein